LSPGYDSGYSPESNPHIPTGTLKGPGYQTKKISLEERIMALAIFNFLAKSVYFSMGVAFSIKRLFTGIGYVT
jgi:hypothetical protein